jgi:hypothetical protein
MVPVTATHTDNHCQDVHMAHVCAATVARYICIKDLLFQCKLEGYKPLKHCKACRCRTAPPGGLTRFTNTATIVPPEYHLVCQVGIH